MKNKENDILLTISIPTFNGSENIERLINSINKEFNSEIVEILVSDNCSTDNTMEIVNSYSFISYYCNETNVGADRNIALSIERAKGKYVWVIGDDDYLTSGAIPYVIDILKKHSELSAIFVNYSLLDVKQNVFLRKKWLNMDNDIYCHNENEFLRTVGVSSNFLSSMIHNKKYFIESDYKKYFDTNWVQLGTLFDYIQGKETYCISTPFVVNAGDSSFGEGNKNGKSIEILCNMMEIISNLPNNTYTINNIDYAKSNVKMFLSRKIISAKRLGLKFNIKLLKKLIYYFGNNPFFWLVQLPIFILPSPFHKLIHKIYKLDFINKTYWKLKKL